MKQEPIAVHTDAYPHDCPACIQDPRAANDDTLWGDHVADVKAVRARTKLSAGTKPLKIPEPEVYL